MTRDRDARAIVCLALAGSIALAIAVILSTRPAPAADDAQSFWRELQTPAPRKVRRIIYVTYRLRRPRFPDGATAKARTATRDMSLGSRVAAPEHRGALGGGPFAGAFIVRQSQIMPASDDADSFRRRAFIPDPPRDMYVPPDLMRRDQLPIFTPPRDRREPSNNRRRELVAVVIVVAVLGGMSSYFVSQRGGLVHV